MDIASLNIVEIAGATGLGSIITILVNKVVTLRRDNQDLKKGNEEYLKTVNANLNETIEKLQELVCYQVNCRMRLNGLDDTHPLMQNTKGLKQPKLHGPD